MSGCAGLLGILEQMKEQPRHYGLRFVFCGSEERGLLGSKAYVAAHAEELDKIVLNINLDMIGTYMGKFIACVSAEEKLSHYITYMAAEVGVSPMQRSARYPARFLRRSERNWTSICIGSGKRHKTKGQIFLSDY